MSAQACCDARDEPTYVTCAVPVRAAASTHPQIERSLDAADEYWVTCEVATHYHTGVEMEALTGATVAALAVYDMCKALSHEIVIRDTRLLHKAGGKRTVGVHQPVSSE